jgi:hypothetical protein
MNLEALTIRELLCLWYAHKGEPIADQAANELAARMFDGVLNQ